MFRSSMIILLGAFLCASTPAQSPPITSAQPEVQLRQDLAGGIGAHMKTPHINSQQDARKAAGEFATYVYNRTGYHLSKLFVLALAEAEWRARATGTGTVPVVRFSERATELFLEALGGPGAKAPRTGGGSPYYVVTPEKLNGARIFYRRHAPNLLPFELPTQVDSLSPAESAMPLVIMAYPIEAFLALYTCVSEDLGRQTNQIPSLSFDSADLASPTAVRARRPFGDVGNSVRRPISKLLSEKILSELLSLAQ